MTDEEKELHKLNQHIFTLKEFDRNLNTIFNVLVSTKERTLLKTTIAYLEVYSELLDKLIKATKDK